MRHVWAWLISMGGAVVVLEATTQLAKRRILIRSGDVRKVMHIATGMIFVCTLTNYNPGGRWVAASVPALMSLRFAAAGLGLVQDKSLVASATRQGKPRELLGGPLLYGVAHALCTGIWFRDSPAALVGLTALCAGDGLAEVVGRRWGGRRTLPHNTSKTWAGSAGCFVATLVASVPLLALFNRPGQLQRHFSTVELVRGSAACALVATLVESLPVKEVDNLTVPFATALAAHYAFPH